MPAWMRESSGPVNLSQNLGFVTTVLYVFALFSMITEISMNVFGFKPYISIISGPLAMFAAVISGQFARVLKIPVGRFFTGLMLWMLLCTPFSVWKGGSVWYLYDAFLKNYSLFFIIIPLALSWRHLRTLFLTISAAAVVDLLVVRMYGGSNEGRFALTYGTLSNPNDFATHFLVTLPFVLYAGAEKKSLKVVSWGVALLVLYTILSSGSRGGFLSLLVLMAFLLLKANPGQKVALAAAACLAGMFAFMFLPHEVWTRLNLITSDDPVEDSQQAIAAAGSTRARRHLLQRSIDLTIQHPVFGVGPGQFAAAEAGDSELSGARASWQVTHNTYTEFSSEDGVPGFLFFASALIACLASNSRIYSYTRKIPELRPLANMAFCLLTSLVVFSVSIMFASMAGYFYAPTLFGFSGALALLAFPVIEEHKRAKAPLATPV